MDGLVFANKFRCILMCDHEHSLALKTFYHLGGILKFLCLYFQWPDISPQPKYAVC